jgi:hypothetical protein
VHIGGAVGAAGRTAGEAGAAAAKPVAEAAVGEAAERAAMPAQVAVEVVANPEAVEAAGLLLRADIDKDKPALPPQRLWLALRS